MIPDLMIHIVCPEKNSVKQLQHNVVWQVWHKVLCQGASNQKLGAQGRFPIGSVPSNVNSIYEGPEKREKIKSQQAKTSKSEKNVFKELNVW